MVDRLSVLCFAGTYALALASDLARFVVRAPLRWFLTVGLTLLGWLVQTVYLGNWVWRSGELPTTTVFGSLVVLAWILAAIDLYLLVRAPRGVAVGVFVLPVVLALLAVAGLMPRVEWTTPGGWVALWGRVHGLLLLAGAVSICVAFATGLMYLAQARRLKLKRPPRFGFALPSLEQSERWNRAAITVAFPLLTFGLLIGVGLVLATQRAGVAVLDWSDPKIVSAAVLWLVFALLLHARFRPEMRGSRVMVLTIVAFGYFLFTLVGVDLLLPTAHGVPQPGGRPL
jgi:ABC-type transport system involved in cytochrome c biogenesis permease subunit